MKLPPKEKIYEAYSAIADGRTELHEDHAIVRSSDNLKEYIVNWDGDTFASSDNATYWQGYPGYPVLAVLLLKGRLTFDEKIIKGMKNIPWKKLNDQYKRDYAKAAEEAFKTVEGDIPAIKKLAEINNREIAELDLTIRRKIKK